MSVRKNTDTAATLAYVERVLRYLASLRYFFDRDDRLLAFVSRAEEKNANIEMNRTSLCQYSEMYILFRKLV